MKHYSILVTIILGIILTNSACKKEDNTNSEPENILAGGETTIFSSGPDAYTFPSANLNAEEINKHFVADAAFAQHFVSAPAENFDGLGPLFNQNSCESCHTRNGRGIVPENGQDFNSGLLLRMSMAGVGEYQGIVPVPGFGGQLQNKAIFSVQPEGKISITETEKIITYLDGEEVTLRKPVFTVTETYIPLPAGVLLSPRIAPPVYGLGLLEAVPEASILALADENDVDNDGISGKPNMVWDIPSQSMLLGRFGWKAEQPSALQQSAGAAHDDMGLTSHYFPEEHCVGQDNCQEGLQTEYDVDAETLEMFAFYFQTLAVPARRNYTATDVIRGEELFVEAKCATCHVPKLTTDNFSITALAHQTIYPYTDLLLHDMGEDLADERPVFSASGSEWRTPPLWGIGLTLVVNPKTGFLHDGRAKTLEEAILWHGGEAETAKNFFTNLSKTDREAVLAFLNSL